jgi:hypothetical protein
MAFRTVRLNGFASGAQLTLQQVMASFASFGSSTINISLLAAWKGHQQAWFCLLACSLDVLVNAFAIYWVTNPGEWSQNAEGFNPSEEIDFTRNISSRHAMSAQQMDHRQERTETNISTRPRESTPLPPPRSSFQDKDAYLLEPQPDVYYQLGEGFCKKGSHALVYQTRSLPAPMIPERILLVSRRGTSETPFFRRNSSIQSSMSEPPRRSSSAACSVNSGESGGMAFLDEEAVRLPLDAVDANRNSQEEEDEGGFQKVFFDIVLGKRKPSDSAVSWVFWTSNAGKLMKSFGSRCDSGNDQITIGYKGFVEI